VGGEAGVGKTRLMRELEREASRRGALVMHGECPDLVGDELPYAPLIGALRRWQDEVELAMADLPQTARSEVGRLLPDRTELVSDRTVGGFAQTRLFELLLGLIGRMAPDAGLLFLVEDLHWSDSSTRSFLSYFARNVSTERVTLVATWRTDEPASAMNAHLAELQRCERVDCFTLAPLSRAEIREQLRAILGRPPEAALVDDLHRRSEGNPFYVEELLALRSGGSGELPEEVRMALLARIETLPESVQELLRALAAFGRPASQELLGAVAGVEEPALSRELRKAASVRVIRRAADDRIAFRHALVREAVYGELLPGERPAFHLAIGEAIERGCDRPDPAELAYHWRYAGRDDAAREASIAAGRAAATMHAFEEASTHFERALDLWKDGPAPERIDLLALAAEAARSKGAIDRAVDLCCTALNELDKEADPARAAWFSERIGRYRFWDFATSEPAFDEALRLLPAGPSADRARVLGDQGHVLMLRVCWEDARERCEEAIRVARAAGAALEEGYALATLGLVLGYLGAAEEGEAHLRQALAIAQEHERAEDMARARVNLSEVLRLQGRLAEALRVTAEGVAEAAVLGVAGAFGRTMAANAAEDLFRLGHWNEAQTQIDELDGVPLSSVGELMRDATAGHLCVARRRYDEAERRFAAAKAQSDQGVPAEFLPTVGTGVAALALARGRPEQALVHAESALGGVLDTEERLYTPMLIAMAARVRAELAAKARVGHADARVAAEHAAAAASHQHALERRLDGVPLGPPPPIALAHLAECRAEVLRAAGRSSPESWRDCAERWAELEIPYAEAYAHLRAGEAVLESGAARREAHGALRAADQIAADLGAGPLLEDIRELASRSRIDLAATAPAAPTAAPASPAEEFELTRRELQVLPLLAEGLTNSQIAARLYISPHTVGVHVSHILAKLDVDNRVAAAAAAHRIGLLDRPSTLERSGVL
jgi:DNA-binding CsgD family transcriptional regulator/tetratricopeptide (TPR) repeat protein